MALLFTPGKGAIKAQTHSLLPPAGEGLFNPYGVRDRGEIT